MCGGTGVGRPALKAGGRRACCRQDSKRLPLRRNRLTRLVAHTPPTPLAQVSYRSYWTREILEVLREHKASLSIKDISERTAIRTGETIRPGV